MPDAPDPGDLARLREHLAERDVACPGCGYNLRGLAGAHCPECNEALMLQVGLVEPRLGAYLGALSGFITGAGGAGIVICFVIYGTLRWGAPSGRDAAAIYFIPMIALITHGAAVIALTRVPGRTWFRRLDGRGRAGVIISGWALIGLLIAWFVAWVT